jgi:putative membrane protein
MRISLQPAAEGGGMSKKKVAAAQPKSLAKGLLAGLIGGLVGAAAMAAAERFLPRRARTDADPPQPAFALDEVHWSFGVAVGAAYGVAAEYFPSATAKEGITFGLALEALSQEGTMPALGLITGSPLAPASSARKITSHVVYGVATEVVRGFVRRRL